MEFLIILLLIILNGFFAMSEIAMISARRSNLEMQARQGDAGARQAQKLIEDPDKFLSTIQIGITLIGILTGIYSGDALATKFGRELAALGISLRTATVVAQITIVIVVTYLTLIFGELVPKRIGMNSAEKIAKLAARPMRLLSLLASPFVWLLSRSTAGVTRLLGLRKSDSKVTEEEIRSIIQEGAEDGEVQEVEQKIMGRVFSLGDRTVESIMTFRSELVWIDTAMTPEQIREQVNREPHNRYPVGEGSLDKLAGVVYLKDLFRHIDDPGFDIRNHLSPAKFFHEGAEVYSALEQLRSEQLGYGIVCDEFGVTRGIVTLKDIFEALVGEIPDGYGEPDIVRREDGSVLIDGQCPFYDFLAFFGAENAVPRNAYNTISGLVLDQLKHIPATGGEAPLEQFRPRDRRHGRRPHRQNTRNTRPSERIMKIADIELGEKPLLLAPMEDVTDPSFRYMCKRFGADVVYTEFISSDGLIRDAAKSLKKLEIDDAERPVGIQLYGHLVEPMVEAARMAEAAGPDIIDINFGCPVKKIAGRGAGSGMMRDVPLMVEMTRRIVEAVGKPVTVKTRLGWDDESKNIEEIALRLQDVGIAALTIHGRTRAQMYRGEADWTLIGKVKNNPRIHIPIIGNGDVDSGPKAAEMFDRYGVDGVMIGRATYGRPWIFREVKHYLATGEVLPQPSVCERVEIAKEHLRKSLEIKGEYVGILEMRRHLSNYFKGLPDFKPTRLKLVTLLDIPELFATLDSIAERWGDFDVSGTVPEPLSHDL